MKVTLTEERLISMAPVDIHGWGPWQFPIVNNIDNTLYLEFHKEEDSARSYGKEKAKYKSIDMGKSWSKTSEQGGLKVNNEITIAPHTNKPFALKNITLPSPLIERMIYDNIYYMYPIEDVKKNYKKWYLKYKVKDKWEIKETKVTIPGYLMTSTLGVFPQPFFWQLTIDNQKNIYAPLYKVTNENGKTSGYMDALYVKSTDYGKTFNLISKIKYEPPYENDPHTNERNGFTEPNICFVNDNTAYTLLRTTDHKGVGPMYIAWSKDSLQTWTKPVYFDDKGVWPQSIMLDNGISIAGYGRAGLHIKCWHENKWSERYDIVTPLEYQTDTCSYCALTPISEKKALIIYSRFDYKDRNNQNRKAIMCREITVEV